MQKLQSSISGRTSLGAAAHSPGTGAYASSRLDRSTTAKMAAKYGQYSEEYRKKSLWEVRCLAPDACLRWAGPAGARLLRGRTAGGSTALPLGLLGARAGG